MEILGPITFAIYHIAKTYCLCFFTAREIEYLTLDISNAPKESGLNRLQ